jgi:hypothetical protein
VIIKKGGGLQKAKHFDWQRLGTTTLKYFEISKAQKFVGIHAVPNQFFVPKINFDCEGCSTSYTMHGCLNFVECIGLLKLHFSSRVRMAKPSS